MDRHQFLSYPPSRASLVLKGALEASADEPAAKRTTFHPDAEHAGVPQDADTLRPTRSPSPPLKRLRKPIFKKGPSHPIYIADIQIVDRSRLGTSRQGDRYSHCGQDIGCIETECSKLSVLKAVLEAECERQVHVGRPHGVCPSRQPPGGLSQPELSFIYPARDWRLGRFVIFPFVSFITRGCLGLSFLLDCWLREVLNEYVSSKLANSSVASLLEPTVKKKAEPKATPSDKADEGKDDDMFSSMQLRVPTNEQLPNLKGYSQPEPVKECFIFGYVVRSQEVDKEPSCTLTSIGSRRNTSSNEQKIDVRNGKRRQRSCRSAAVDVAWTGGVEPTAYPAAVGGGWRRTGHGSGGRLGSAMEHRYAGLGREAARRASGGGRSDDRGHASTVEVRDLASKAARQWGCGRACGALATEVGESPPLPGLLVVVISSS
uniref:Uncharacterized protein n=1 Tax=Oryza brachyantha TaxID=4533 RepID=J3MVS2_ORYBR